MSKVRATRDLYFVPDREARGGWRQLERPTAFAMTVAKGTPGEVKDRRGDELLVQWEEGVTESIETARVLNRDAVWTVRSRVEEV